MHDRTVASIRAASRQAVGKVTEAFQVSTPTAAPKRFGDLSAFNLNGLQGFALADCFLSPRQALGFSLVNGYVWSPSHKTALLLLV